MYGSLSRTVSSSYSSPSAVAAAAAIDPRHWIEIAFSSFHMSRVVNQTCTNGRLKVSRTIIFEFNLTSSHPAVISFFFRKCKFRVDFGDDGKLQINDEHILRQSVEQLTLSNLLNQCEECNTSF